MSAYAVNKIGWLVVHDEAFRKRLVGQPETTLDELDLEPAERAALLAGDMAELYRLGAHEYLLFSIGKSGAFGLSLPLYIQRIRQATPIPPPDTASFFGP